MKSKIISNILIPNSLFKAINELDLTETNKSHAIKFIQILMRDSYRKFGNIFYFTAKPKTFLDSTFSTKYSKWLNVLLNSNLIERDFYKEGRCFHYRINPAYFITEFNLVTLCMENNHKILINKKIVHKIKYTNNGIRQYQNWFKNDIKSLIINYENLIQISANTIINLKINDFKIDDEIPDGFYQYVINGSVSDNYSSLNYIKILASNEGKHVILRKKKCVISDFDDFIYQMRLSYFIYHQNIIENFKMGNFYVNRNDTNNRLDTNLTNMYSPLVDEICRQNGLVQIDISNSQFAFLSWILKTELNSDDFKTFKRFSITGHLYKYLSTLLGVESRKEAKNAMFEILFSSRKYNSQQKLQLKQLMPRLIAWIDEFKKNNGDNSFSIMLQKKESEIMIDGLLSKIKKDGYFCLTKHDSIIIRKENYSEIIKLVEGYFVFIGFECQLKTTWCYNDNPKNKFHPVHHVLLPENCSLSLNIPFLSQIHNSKFIA